MKKHIAAKAKTWNSGVGKGDSVQAEYFAAIGVIGEFDSWCATVDGIWFSAGAAYGPQVEFPTEDSAEEFIRENKGASRAGFCGKRIRVSTPSVPLFVAAYKAAKGEKPAADKELSEYEQFLAWKAAQAK